MEKQYINLPKTIIDTHCHGRDMRQAYKTTVQQTIKEAKSANISVSCFMPNTDPPLITVDILKEYLNLIENAREELDLPQQYVWFGVTDDNPYECQKAILLPEVVGFKIYPKSKSGKLVTTGTIGVAEDSRILYAMYLARSNKKATAFHCDDPEIIAQEGNTVNAEVSYVKRIIQLAEKVPGGKIVICHVSCIESAYYILKAQKEGMQIAMELCPQYLWFDSDKTNWRPDLDPIFYHCYNNLRTKMNREFLANLLAIRNPLIMIGSDNAVHMPQEKLEKKLGGLPTNQEMVSVPCTLAKRLNLSDLQIANLLSFNASRFLGIPVPYELVEYELEEKVDDITYNNGLIINPWNGSKLLFPIRKEEKDDNI